MDCISKGDGHEVLSIQQSERGREVEDMDCVKFVVKRYEMGRFSSFKGIF